MILIINEEHADNILRYAIKECNKYYDYEVLINRLQEMSCYIKSFEFYGYKFHAEMLRIWVKIMKKNYQIKRRMDKKKLKNEKKNSKQYVYLHDFLL